MHHDQRRPVRGLRQDLFQERFCLRVEEPVVLAGHRDIESTDAHRPIGGHDMVQRSVCRQTTSVAKTGAKGFALVVVAGNGEERQIERIEETASQGIFAGGALLR